MARRAKVAAITRGSRSSSYTYNARGRLATVSQNGNLKGTCLEQLSSRLVTNSGPFNGTVHTTQDQRRAGGAQGSGGNILAKADGTTGVVAKEYIWLPADVIARAPIGEGVNRIAQETWATRVPTCLRAWWMRQEWLIFHGFIC